MGILSVVITTAICAVVLAAIAYQPLPHDYMGGGADRSKAMAMQVIAKFIVYFPCELMHLLGLETVYLFVSRSLFGKFGSLRSSVSADSVFREDFDGVKVVISVPKTKPGNDGPALVFFHGGGFVILSAESYVNKLTRLANQLGMPIFSVEYRLAPEHPFPAGPDDCERATAHLMKPEVARRFGVDPKKILVAGDSAGGNLAIVTARRIRDRQDTPNAMGQILIYPVAQMSDYNLPSYHEEAQLGIPNPVLYPSIMARWMAMYVGVDRAYVPLMLDGSHVHPDHSSSKRYQAILGEGMGDIPDKTRRVPEDALALKHSKRSWDEAVVRKAREEFKDYLMNQDVSPLFIRDPSGLPPTFLITCGYDILRDEGYLLGEQLKKAGVHLTYQHFENAFHGVFPMSDIFEEARQMDRAIEKFVKKL